MEKTLNSSKNHGTYPRVISLDQYKDAIGIMMMHGTNIDIIANKLKVSFKRLDAYITKEGLYEKHKRRGWAMKTTDPKRKHRGVSTRPPRTRGVERKIPND